MAGSEVRAGDATENWPDRKRHKAVGLTGGEGRIENGEQGNIGRLFVVQTVGLGGGSMSFSVGLGGGLR